MRPALSPTRGSGLGGVVDMFTAGDAPSLAIEDVECAQAAVNSNPTAIGSAGPRAAVARTNRRRARNTDAIAKTSRGAGRTSGEKTAAPLLLRAPLERLSAEHLLHARDLRR